MSNHRKTGHPRSKARQSPDLASRNRRPDVLCFDHADTNKPRRSYESSCHQTRRCSSHYLNTAQEIISTTSLALQQLHQRLIHSLLLQQKPRKRKRKRRNPRKICSFSSLFCFFCLFLFLLDYFILVALLFVS